MPNKNSDLKKPEKRKTIGSRWLWISLILLAFLLGIGVRFYDLTDAPLDFHSTRQLHSALIARGMYYQTLVGAPEWQKEMSYKQWQAEGLIEPQIMERLTAMTYQVIGAEHLWVARVWAVLFWTLGGVFLFILTKDLFGMAGSALAVIYFMLWPYAVISSRAFQPESLMVAVIIIALLAVVRWFRQPSYARVILAGLFCGLAIYVKSVAVFFIAPALAGLLLTNFDLSQIIKNKQVWLLFILSVSPYIAYHIYGVYVLGLLGSQFSLRFFPNLWLSPVFYLQWIGEISSVMGWEIFLVALVGLLLFPQKQYRGLLIGLLVGYFLYGFVFSYHISTHDYYQMPLLAMAALGLAAIFQFIVEKMPEKKLASNAVLALILISFMILKTWDARVTLKRSDYHNETRFWEKLGEKLGHESSVVGLLSDYGYRLAYWGWVNVTPWLQTSDINLRELAGQEVDFEESFQNAIQGKDYFVVTLMNEFYSQEELQDTLNRNYALIEKSDEVLIYDLR